MWFELTRNGMRNYCMHYMYTYIYMYALWYAALRDDTVPNAWAIVYSAIITHSIPRQLKPRPLHQQNQPGLPDFSRETLKNMGRPGSRLDIDSIGYYLFAHMVF